MRANRTEIIIVGLFAAIAGLGEIIVGFTGNFLGILSHSIAPAVSTIVIATCCSLGGWRFVPPNVPTQDFGAAS